MIQGSICIGARTKLVFIEGWSPTAKRYITDILETHVMTLAHFVGEDFIFMHVKAQPCTCVKVGDYLNAVGIAKMDLPAQSLDVNPIEHV